MAAENGVGDEPEASTVRALTACFNPTDLGNAERLVARYRDRIRYCAQRDKWLLWDNKRWRWDDSAAIERMAKRTAKSILVEASQLAKSEDLVKWALQSENQKRIMAMIALARSEEGIPIHLSELDANPWLLNCENGTVNLKTGELMQPSRDDMITRSTGVAYKPEARSEIWDKVLADATGGDAMLAVYLQRMVGYMLLGDPVERACFFLYGPPGTSKSTFIEAAHVALGEYSQTAAFDTWLVRAHVGGNRGDLVRLAGARLVTSTEVAANAKWDDSLLNNVTGGDEITAAAKYEDDVTFKPTFTLLFAANNAPTVADQAEGFWKRMRRVPLTAVIPLEKQDRGLKAKLHLPEQAEAILAWAIDGCLEYLKHGFAECPAVEASTAEYKAEVDHFSEFLSDCFVIDSAGSVTRKQFREKYLEWSEEVGRKHTMTATQCWKRLEGFCTQGAVGGTRLWRGIREKFPRDTHGQEG